MGNGRSSGLPKGVKDRTSETKKDAMKDLRVKSKKVGYDIKEHTMSTDKDLGDKQKAALQTALDSLESYQKALGEPASFVKEAGGTVAFHSYTGKDEKKVAGDCDADGNVRIANRFLEAYHVADTLPHEHTHNIVNTLITKQLGYAKGSPEFNKAYKDGAMNRDIAETAMKNWKAEQLASLNKQYAQVERQLDALGKYDPKRSSLISKLADLSTARARVSNVSHPYDAARLTRMREYACKDYFWSPKGACIEVPSVSAELLVKYGYSMTTLHSKSPYAYHVLKEIQKRMKKYK